MAKKSSAKKKKISWGAVLDVLSEGKDALKGADERLLLRVHVGTDCPRELACAVKGALVAERAGAEVEVMSAAVAVPATQPDAVLVLVGAEDVSALAGSYARQGVPVALIVEGALDAPELDLPEACAGLVTTLAASSAAALPARLADWLVGVVDKPLALAANFPFCREAVVGPLVVRCAAENAAVGAVSFLPGSDLPLMCANQAKLVLDIAAAYGRRVDVARALELAGVVGAGFAYRAVARTLAGLIPGAGLVLKAGIGYGGTVATARAVQARLRLEDGELELPDLSGLPFFGAAGHGGGETARPGRATGLIAAAAGEPAQDAGDAPAYISYGGGA